MIIKSVVMVLFTVSNGQVHYGPTSFYNSVSECENHAISLVKSVPDIPLTIKCHSITKVTSTPVR